MANKRRPLRIPAFLCVLATTVYTLGNLCSGPQVQAQAQTGWQDVAGGNFLADSTVSGDVGKIIADTATGTFTSGKESGTVYLDLYQEGSDSRAQIAPAEGALLAYDIEVVRGGIYLNPETSSGWKVGNAFIQAINNAHNTDGGESSLGQGQYTGAVDLSEEWPAGKEANNAMLKLEPNSQVIIRKLKFIEPKTELADVPGGNLLYKYEPVYDKNVECDAETGTFTNNDTTDADIILDLYQGEGNRASIKPVDGALLAYDIEVVRGGIYLNPETSSGWLVGNVFIQAINNAHSTGGGESSLGQGHYTGTVDLSEVWSTDKGTDSILVRLPTGSSVIIKTLKFVVSRETLVSTDVAGGDLLADYTPTVDKEQASCNKTTGTFSNNDNATADFWLRMTSTVKPADGALLAYEIDVTDGDVYISPCCPAIGQHNYPLGDAFIKAVNIAAQMSDHPSRLLPGHYEGAVDLSGLWSSDQAAAYVLVRLPAGAQATIHKLKFIVPTPTGEMIDSSNGNFLSSYKVTVDVGKIIADQTERVFTSGEGYGSVVLTPGQSITPTDGTRLYYDFVIEMVEHTLDDINHRYHGRSAFKIDVPSLSPDNSDALSSALLDGIARDNSKEVWEGTLPAGEYQGVLDLSAVWGTGAAAAALNLRLNEFTRVTLKEWKLVSEISQPTVSYTVSIPSGTQNISAGGVTSIGAVGVTVLTAEPGDSLSVSASSGEAYALVQGEWQIPYKLTTDDQGIQGFTGFSFDAVGSRPLYISVEQTDWDAAPAGDYTDTITFTVAYHPAASTP